MRRRPGHVHRRRARFPGHLEAACEAALELQLNRLVTHEDDHDPLKDLEASLIDESAFASWGGASFAEARGSGGDGQ